MIIHEKLITIDEYEPLIGREAVERILNKAKQLQGVTVSNVNATQYGGGVAEILASLTLLMNTMGVKTDWQVLLGNARFFDCTKGMHNALQSGDNPITKEMRDVYERTLAENALRMQLEHDIVVIHDPQPLPLIEYRKTKNPWIWRCHIDMSDPQPDLWKYLKPHVNKYDESIFSIEEYKQELDIPQNLFMPATDPFALKNRLLSDKVMDAALKRHNIPTDLPIVCQISRFDKWKDPAGVIDAYKLAAKKSECTLVMLGNAATDDPEGKEVYESLVDQQSERIIISDKGDDTELVNTLQKRSAAIIQKSIREGFGLTVTEAMVKGTPVIGGNVGGIKYQIKDGENGFLVNSPEEAAERIVELINDSEKRDAMGAKAKQSVNDNFLLTRLCEQYFDLFISLLDKKKKSQVSMA